MHVVRGTKTEAGFTCNGLICGLARGERVLRRRIPAPSEPGSFPAFAPKSADRDIVALGDALQALAKIDPRKEKVVELCFLGGPSVDETAAVQEISAQTAMREWKMARTWLLLGLAS